MFNMLLAAAAEGAAPVNEGLAMVMQFGSLILLVVVMYFILIRPQKKKEKETKNMISTLGVGDTITTIGGIVGKIAKMKDEEVLIETGMVGNPNERSTMRIAKWAIKDVVKKSDSSSADMEIEEADGDDSEN